MALGDFYFSAPVKPTRIVARDGANFDTSFRQILSMESEILWESDITPTLVSP
jgi:hypothetical protein